ncbi:MAG: zf-HC2 domain-containing protein [Anaerotignum sp.]|nr:zf-HC2 domain-containing protein [Anaerotignum sp.]
MNCEAVREILGAYLEKETTAEEAAKIEEHLKHCADCGEEMELQQEMMETLSGLPDEELPEGYHTELMQKLQAEAASNVVPFPAKKKKQSVWKQWGMIAAAVLVVVVAGGMNGMLEMRESQNMAVQEMKAADTVEPVEISMENVAEEGSDAEFQKNDAVTYKKMVTPAVDAETADATMQRDTKESAAVYDTEAVPKMASVEAEEEAIPFSMTRSVKVEATDKGTLLVTDIAAAMAELQKAIAEAGGFEETAEEGSVIASIPAENYEGFVRAMEQIGTLDWTKKSEADGGALLRTVEIQLKMN